MGIYDGNQLPEAPTSQFQMAVSILYALFICIMMSLGGFAMLAAQHAVDQESHPNNYMCSLVRKHNAIVRGALAFIPATYSLVHLYTSGLHNGALYSAGNVVYAALLGFAAKYMGEVLNQLVEDSKHMDTIKAVYECCYMLNAAACKLFLTEDKPHRILDDKDLWMPRQELALEKQQRKEKVDSLFLSVACQDDSRIWSQTLKALCAFNHEQYPKDLKVKPVQKSAAAGGSPACTPYAYWLYSQDITVRGYTGSIIFGQKIEDKLNTLSFAAGELYIPAKRYIELMSNHFLKALKEKLQGDACFMLRGIDGQLMTVCAPGVAPAVNGQVEAFVILSCPASCLL